MLLTTAQTHKRDTLERKQNLLANGFFVSVCVFSHLKIKKALNGNNFILSGLVFFGSTRLLCGNATDSKRQSSAHVFSRLSPPQPCRRHTRLHLIILRIHNSRPPHTHTHIQFSLLSAICSHTPKERERHRERSRPSYVFFFSLSNNWYWVDFFFSI